MALVAEATGLDSVWIADHFFIQDDAGNITGMHDAWTLLGAVAAVTKRVELGPLVLCASFRTPGVIANMATTLDLISGGRLILGLGAGWHDPEYDAFDVPTDHRVGRFAESLEIVVRLLRGERVTFAGTYHSVRDAALAPEPERRIPILVAADRPRMLRLTARWADSWNSAWYGAPDDELEQNVAALDAALEEVGRDPSEVARTVGIDVRDPDQTAGAGGAGGSFVEGSIEELAGVLDAYAERGVDHLIGRLVPGNIRSVERFAEAARISRGRSSATR